jgi:hypothetical protein
MSAQQLEKVSIIPEREQLPAVVTPMAMLAKAVEGGADINVLEKLMGLSERWEANQARKAFDEAISAAKLEIPPIERNAKGHNEKRYADFSAIAKVVDPILGKHGLSYRFRTSQTDRISVTCVLSHKAGHSEETTLSGPADNTGSKNAIQAIGSTLTYLQRYSLVQMLGLAAERDDDGGGISAGHKITDEQRMQLVALADDVGADKVAFCKYMKIASLADLPAKDFNRAVAALNKKRAQA